MKKFIKFDEAPVILRITGSGIPPPNSTLFYPGNSPDNGDPLNRYSQITSSKPYFIFLQP